MMRALPLILAGWLPASPPRLEQASRRAPDYGAVSRQECLRRSAAGPALRAGLRRTERFDSADVERIGDGRCVTSNIRALSLLGQHRWAPQRSVSWELLMHEQGDAYTPKGFHVGLRYEF